MARFARFRGCVSVVTRGGNNASSESPALAEMIVWRACEVKLQGPATQRSGIIRGMIVGVKQPVTIGISTIEHRKIRSVRACGSGRWQDEARDEFARPI